MLGEVIDPDCHGEIGLLLNNGSKKDYIWSAGDPSGNLLVLPHHVTKINRKLQQPNSGRVAKGKDPSRIKVQSLLQEKNLLRFLLRMDEI